LEFDINVKGVRILICVQIVMKKIHIVKWIKNTLLKHTRKNLENVSKIPLTEAEVQEKKRILQERISAMKIMKMEEEKKSEIEKEKNRVISGKEAAVAKRKFEEDQQTREAEKRKKEKEADKIAKEKIKAKIEQDKRERAERLAKEKGEIIPQTQTNQPTTTESSTQTTQTNQSKKEYTDALIQFRFQRGETLKAKFSAKDTMRDVMKHVEMLQGNNRFTLLSNYPKKIYSFQDNFSLNVSLVDAQLVPNGTLVVNVL